MNSKSSRTQIIVAVIGVMGAIAVAVVSQLDWNGSSANGLREPAKTEQVKQTDPLDGFYVRDGLANSPVLKITQA